MLKLSSSQAQKPAQKKKKPSASAPKVTPTHLEVPGRIKWFNPKSGYGFVVCDGVPKDVFLHMEVLQKCGLKDIAEDRLVHVTFGTGPKGLVATELRV